MDSKFVLKFFLPISIMLLLSGSADAQGLKVGFYKKTCPNAETIVYNEMKRVISVAPSLAGPLLRLFFHDCFVRGCDASILLNSTKNNVAEKESPPNLSLRGYGVIDTIKAKLEKACPGIVSCADITALVARDAVYLSKGPSWEVPTGRRDGRASLIAEARQLPAPIFTFQQLKASFAQKGLSVKDLVVLSGGHTLGTSQCSFFSPRLYNFTGKGDADPSLDSEYVIKLKSKCKPTDTTKLAEMDPGSFLSFDTDYYKIVLKRRGLFGTDSALLQDAETRSYVQRQAKASNPREFFKDFGVSMVNMGNTGVLIGKQGEIRKNCAVVN